MKTPEEERMAWLQSQFEQHPELYYDPLILGEQSTERVIQVVLQRRRNNFPNIPGSNWSTTMQNIEQDAEYQRLRQANDKVGVNRRIRRIIQENQLTNEAYNYIVNWGDLVPQVQADGTWTMTSWDDHSPLLRTLEYAEQNRNASQRKAGGTHHRWADTGQARPSKRPGQRSILLWRSL